MNRYPIPAQRSSAEIEILKSRFIATLAPVFTVEEARDFIKQIRAEHATASHNVPAFLIGHGNNVTAHCSDDGEPSGTAGKPMLAVLRGSGLGDLAVVVTRYYGGTNLGTGGLVRAYSGAVKEVLSVTPKAEKVPTHTIMVAFPYTLFERVKLLAAEFNGQLLDEEFAADITLTIQFEIERFDAFNHRLIEMTGGGISAEIIETNPSTIMPLPQKPSFS